ncbi:Damaged dna-binding 2, putative isoform 1 [Quillaja saponaria]|uniref:Damaged dna-binding 2, putative isoform 1 n=1 Tax=Quillaja saponaria TaxID=32244 RepID=A0AAD7LD79_QUISA|nr:Damaged dna-binding 2, putative isoform 1 [Quillaja saponaria]
MSIATESNGGRTIKRSKFVDAMACMSIYDRSFLLEREDDSDSCTSSSIGRNSGLSGGYSDGEDSGDSEVQSSLKGPLDTMDALEDVLPVKRGISKFCNGKSKSFTSLADISSLTSVEDIVKPDNPYTRKRKNLLAHNTFSDVDWNCSLKNNIGVGISKRPANFSQDRFSYGVTLSSSGSLTNSEEGNSLSTSPSSGLPPLHPYGGMLPANGLFSFSPPQISPWRSFSFSDLQSVAE